MERRDSIIVASSLITMGGTIVAANSAVGYLLIISGVLVWKLDE